MSIRRFNCEGQPVVDDNGQWILYDDFAKALAFQIEVRDEAIEKLERKLQFESDKTDKLESEVKEAMGTGARLATFNEYVKNDVAIDIIEEALLFIEDLISSFDYVGTGSDDSPDAEDIRRFEILKQRASALTRTMTNE